jgi:predicted nucleic acid-binding Zn finger protein
MATDRIKSRQELFDSGVIINYNNDGTFSMTGKIYKFNETFCNCMDMIGHKPNEGCKHINCFKLWIKNNKDPRKNEIDNKRNKYKELVQYMEKNGNAVYFETLYEMFGEEIVDNADKDNVIMKAGKMYILLL